MRAIVDAWKGLKKAVTHDDDEGSSRGGGSHQERELEKTYNQASSVLQELEEILRPKTDRAGEKS